MPCQRDSTCDQDLCRLNNLLKSQTKLVQKQKEEEKTMDLRSSKLGAEEMAQWLKAPGALAEDTTHWLPTS